MKTDMSYYPLFLDIRKKRCVVFGGGMVALRKVNMLLDHQAQVEVISPNLCQELEVFVGNGSITTIRREYRSGDLDGAFVVIAATNNQESNELIASEAQDRGVLINVVDVPVLSNFIVPSYLRRGNLTIAVSTSGSSPARARRIKEEFEIEYGAEYAELVSLVEEVRTQNKGKLISGEEWQEALDISKLLGLIRENNRDLAKTQLLSVLRGNACD